MLTSIANWTETAFSTYVLHVEHGNGYQWWSGVGGRTLGVGFVTAVLWHHFNCHEPGCYRKARHGNVYCKEHSR